MNLRASLASLIAALGGFARAAVRILSRLARKNGADGAAAEGDDWDGIAPARPPASRTRAPRRAVAAAIVVAAAGTLGLLAAAASASRGRGRAEGRDRGTSFANTEYMRMLAVPGPAPGETPFPLAFERKTRYNEGDMERHSPDFGAMDLEEFSRDRKAELEALFDAVD